MGFLLSYYNMPALFISAAHKSSGKTTISIGLCAAFQAKGLHVQPFKKGPDYIDPMWLGRAAQYPCFNLDFNTMGNEEIIQVVREYKYHADIAVIEGNKGLYDGLDLQGSNSNAALAKLLQTPVVLVIDVRGMTRGIAPLILGYQQFDDEINIAGVILNQLGGTRHESKLRAVIEHYTDVEVLGGVHCDPQLLIEERHLGLLPENESDQAEKKIQDIGTLIAQQVNLESLQQLAEKFIPENLVRMREYKPILNKKNHYKIGILRDAAFGFYYSGDLEAFKKQGVDIVFIDALKQDYLPEIDGLFIGGGFPEARMRDLEKNTALRTAIYNQIEAGLPTYAECGGLMYLTRTITWNNNTAKMVGVIKADTIMHNKPQGRGYVTLECQKNIWPDQDKKRIISAHEFHYSSLVNLEKGYHYAYRIIRGQGIDGTKDGLIYKNTLASYAHLQDTEKHHWVKRFIDFIIVCKEKVHHYGK